MDSPQFQCQSLSIDPDVFFPFTMDLNDWIESIFDANADLNTPCQPQADSWDPAFSGYHNRLDSSYVPMSGPTTHENPVHLPAHVSQQLASPSGFSEYSADTDSVSEFERSTYSPIASTSFPLILEETPLQSTNQSQRRHVRLLTSQNPTRRNAAEAIVERMLSHPVDAQPYDNTQHVPPLPELQTYIESLDIATRGWVEEGSQRSIGTDSNRAASIARKEKPTATLYVCRWCRSTFTKNHNLDSHVRRHLDLHISFCDRCDYSSISATIPARHRKTCEAKSAKFIL